MKIRAYLSILRIRLLTGLQYRMAALAGIPINLLWGFILTTTLMIFYNLGRSHNTAMTIEQGVTYIWLAQGFINLSPMQMDNEIYQKITSGDFAYELCRPLDLYNHWFMRALAQRLSSTILKSGLIFVVCFILPSPYRMLPPVSFTALIGTMVALAGALLLSCSITSIMNVNFLKVDVGLGVNNLTIALMTVASGLLIPIYVFPDWLQPLLRVLPFAGLVDFPASIYTGLAMPSEIWWMITKQVIWIVVLIALGRWRFNAALRRTVIQGG